MDRFPRFDWGWTTADGDADTAAELDVEARIAFCRQAEACGVEGLALPGGRGAPDPLVLAMALGAATERIRFLVPCRPGVASPTAFVQQINTLSALVDGRVAIVVEAAGAAPAERARYGDRLDGEQALRRADEFLSICRALWTDDAPVSFEGRWYRLENARLNTPFVSPARPRPEIHVLCGSRSTRTLAVRHGDCALIPAAAPAMLAAQVAPLAEAGVAVGMAIALDGPSERVAAAIAAYHRAGVGRLILQGGLDAEQLKRFHQRLLPAVRARLDGASAGSQDAVA